MEFNKVCQPMQYCLCTKLLYQQCLCVCRRSDKTHTPHDLGFWFHYAPENIYVHNSSVLYEHLSFIVASYFHAMNQRGGGY